MEPPPRDDGDESPIATPQLSPTSEVGSAQASLMTDTNWRQLLEQQNRNMIRLINAMRPPSSTPSAITLPEFNPELPDANPQAWCSTVDICLTEHPLEGGALIITLSKSLKGTASTWLSHVSHPGMTWVNFKELFMARYDSAETCAATIIHAINSRPKEGENLAAYASRLITSLMAKWKDMKSEEIAVSFVLAHLAQIDGRINRVAFTTDIKTRTKLIQEVQAFSIKRKQERPDNFAPESKRIKANVNSLDLNNHIQCHNCHKFGHKSIDCFTRKSKSLTSLRSTPSKPITTDTKRSVTCFRCGERGHIAPHCTNTSGGGGNGAPTAGTSTGAGGAALERRINFCEVRGVRGELSQSGTHEDV